MENCWSMLHKRLTGVINEMGIDNFMNIPDYVISNFMCENLQELFVLMQEKENHNTEEIKKETG